MNVMRALLALLLFSCLATPLFAQKAGEVWRFPVREVRVDSVAVGKVHYTVLASELTPSTVGRKYSADTTSFRQVHVLKVIAPVPPVVDTVKPPPVDTVKPPVPDTTKPPVVPPPAPQPISGDPTRGEAAWRLECMSCHTAPQGWDVAHFHYSDSTIVRRALGHVPPATAWDIVAHVRSLAVADTMTPTKRPFQPGGVLLSSDQEFGVRLFGSDAWPASLTRDQLLAMDPRTIPMALPLPAWSDEASNYDWLPGSPATGKLPAGVRAAAATVLDAYYAKPSLQGAANAAQRVRILAHDASIPDAPCTYLDVPSRYDAQKCADVAKWVAAFMYVEGVRSGDLKGTAAVATREWWETGHLFHKAQQFKRQIPERDIQIAGWIYLGWMWNRALNKNSLYFAGPAAALGHNRLAAFHILRTMVERKAGSVPLCGDVESLGQWGATQWLSEVMAFAYRELQYRASVGELPRDHQFCADQVRLAQIWVGKRTGSANAAALKPLADATMAIVLK